MLQAVLGWCLALEHSFVAQSWGNSCYSVAVAKNIVMMYSQGARNSYYLRGPSRQELQDEFSWYTGGAGGVNLDKSRSVPHTTSLTRNHNKSHLVKILSLYSPYMVLYMLYLLHVPILDSIFEDTVAIIGHQRKYCRASPPRRYTMTVSLKILSQQLVIKENTVAHLLLGGIRCSWLQ